MKRQLATVLLAIVIGILGFAVSGVAVAAGNGKPPSPPGQGECEHGNSEKPCKEDPQPDSGKDCEAHGNNGGVNEDHCAGEETTPPPTTPNETTPNETTPNETTPNETTPSETTPQQEVPADGSNPSTPPSTASGEPNSTQATQSSSSQATEPNSSDSSQPAPKIVGKPPVAAAKKKQAAAGANKQAAAPGPAADAPKPTRQAQQAPHTL